jgi:hypothetical protein
VGYSKINAHLTLHYWQWFRLFYLTREDDIPLSCLIFDRGCFDVDLYLTVQLNLDGTDLGDMYTIIMRETIAALGIGEAVVAVPALKSRKSRLFTVFDTAEEVVKGFLQPSKDILQYLRVDILVFFPDLLDFWQLVCLLIVVD